MASQDDATAAKQRHSADLLRRPEVSGVGTARSGDDDWVVQVHVNAGSAPDLPPALDGVPLEVVADGPFTAGPAKRAAG